MGKISYMKEKWGNYCFVLIFLVTLQTNFRFYYKTDYNYYATLEKLNIKN
jgi:hypothetical protein